MLPLFVCFLLHWFVSFLLFCLFSVLFVCCVFFILSAIVCFHVYQQWRMIRSRASGRFIMLKDSALKYEMVGYFIEEWIMSSQKMCALYDLDVSYRKCWIWNSQTERQRETSDELMRLKK